MNASVVQCLWQYMVHADQQVLAAAATVPEEGWDRDLAISAGSLRKLLNHCIDAQARWLVRIGGPEVPVPPEIPRDQLHPVWQPVHRALLDFAGEQTDATLTAIVHADDRGGNAFSMARGFCMLHIADHATYHRGQLNSMIKLAGGTPTRTMFFSFAKTANFLHPFPSAS